MPYPSPSLFPGPGVFPGASPGGGASTLPQLTVPRLKVPFELDGDHLAVVEQDSQEEVTQSVYVLLATERGSRLDDPDYGVEEAGFDPFPPEDALDEWLVQIANYEPRAKVRTVAELEDLVARITVQVSA